MTTLSSVLNYITGIKVKLNVTPLYCGHCREDGSYRCSRGSTVVPVAALYVSTMQYLNYHDTIAVVIMTSEVR